MVSSLAEKTIKHVASKLETGEAAGLSEIVELIQRLSTNAYDTSIQELALSIGKDVVVTAKVITAANTMGYNPLGIEVSTITQAIHVIGFNKIRQLAVSLLLVENANRKMTPAEKREIAALALCSGLMAESIMAQRGSCSPEHAFICASLRNYGRLLMTSFMIEDYRRAKELSFAGSNEDEAFRKIFGLTPLELGHHLLECAHLPDPILKSLRSLPIDAIKLATEQPDMELITLADLAVKACELALRSDVSAQEFTMKAAALAARSGKVFGLDAAGLLTMLSETGQQLSEFANTFGLTSLSDQFAPRIRARANGKDVAGYQPHFPAKIAADDLTSTSPLDSESAPDSEQTPAEKALAANLEVISDLSAKKFDLSRLPPSEAADNPPASAEETLFQYAFQSGIQQLAGLIDADKIDMRKVYSVVLRSALVGFESRDAVIFVRDSRTRRYLAHFGSGKLFEAIKNTAVVRDDERTVFGLCLQRNEDVLISDATDAKIAPHLPAWLKPGLLTSFTLLPMQENKQPFAILMTAWPEKKALGFTVSQIRQVRSMLKLVGTARKLGER